MRDAKRRGLLCLSCSLLIPALVLGQDQACQPDQPAASGQHASPAIAPAGNWLMPVPKPGTPIRVIERSGQIDNWPARRCASFSAFVCSQTASRVRCR